jgi:AraC-like DNA-binding protein
MVKFPTDIPVPADDDDEAALRLLAALSDEDAPKANGQPRFARTRDAWLKMVLAERRLTASDIRLCVALFLHFNFKRYAKTDKLLAWPSWETIAAEAHLSKASIARGFQKLEQLGALKITHGGRDPVTRWKLQNRYEALLPPGLKLRPGQVSKRDKSRSQEGTRLDERDSMKKNAPPSAARRPSKHKPTKKSGGSFRKAASAWRPASAPKAPSTPPPVPRGPPPRCHDMTAGTERAADDEARLERYRRAANGGGQ